MSDKNWSPAKLADHRATEAISSGKPAGQSGGAGNFPTGDAHATPQHLPFDGSHEHDHLDANGLSHKHPHDHSQDYSHEHSHNGQPYGSQMLGGQQGGFNYQQPAEPDPNTKPDAAYKSQWNQQG